MSTPCFYQMDNLTRIQHRLIVLGMTYPHLGGYACRERGIMSKNVDYLERVVMWAGNLLVAGAVVFVLVWGWSNANAMTANYVNDNPAVTEVR